MNTNIKQEGMTVPRHYKAKRTPDCFVVPRNDECPVRTVIGMVEANTRSESKKIAGKAQMPTVLCRSLTKIACLFLTIGTIVMIPACEKEARLYVCPEVLPVSPYRDPVCHPSGNIIGFYHQPVKKINYETWIRCPQIGYIYEKDSSGFWLINSDGTNRRMVMPYSVEIPFTLTPISWSPTGNWFAFHKGQLYIMPFEGNKFDTTAIVRLTNERIGADLSWSPDGNRISFSKGGQLYIVPFDGNKFDTTAIVRLTNESVNSYHTWSPDGKWIAYDLKTESGEYSIWKIKIDGSEKKRLMNTSSQRTPYKLFWRKDFTILYAEGTNVFKMDSAGININRLTNNDIGAIDCQFSPDGTYFSYITDPHLRLWVVNLETNNSIVATEGCSSYSWFPDGKIVYEYFYYNRIDEEKGTLWTIKPDGTNKKQLTKNYYTIIYD
jgi:Tol biopolymer transport system component